MEYAPTPLHDIEFESLTLEEARLHLRLDAVGSPPTHPDDDLVLALNVAAREHAEYYTSQAFARQSYELALDEFPAGAIDLGVWPVLSVDSVAYVDQAGATQTLDAANYALNNSRKPASLALAFGTAWPATRVQDAAIKITFTAGRTDDLSPNPQPTPKSAKQAMLLMLGHLYENREALGKKDYNVELPLGVMALLQQHRIAIGL